MSKDKNPYKDPNFRFTDTQIENLINILISYDDPDSYISCVTSKRKKKEKSNGNR